MGVGVVLAVSCFFYICLFLAPALVLSLCPAKSFGLDAPSNP